MKDRERDGKPDRPFPLPPPSPPGPGERAGVGLASRLRLPFPALAPVSIPPKIARNPHSSCRALSRDAHVSRRPDRLERFQRPARCRPRKHHDGSLADSRRARNWRGETWRRRRNWRLKLARFSNPQPKAISVIDLSVSARSRHARPIRSKRILEFSKSDNGCTCEEFHVCPVCATPALQVPAEPPLSAASQTMWTTLIFCWTAALLLVWRITSL